MTAASSVPSIHAVGDVTNRITLTPVATAEAMWLALTLFRGEPTPVDHENVPTAVFANPNLATVGLSEEKARERFGAVDVYKTSFRALKLAMSDQQERTFMKLVVDRASQRVVGAHMIGADAGEIARQMERRGDLLRQRLGDDAMRPDKGDEERAKDDMATHATA